MSGERPQLPSRKFIYSVMMARSAEIDRERDMSDESERRLERIYRESGDVRDGMAWVHEVMRGQSTPVLQLIEVTIRNTRALLSMLYATPHSQPIGALSYSRPVTPDDIVSFLRGTDDWLSPTTVQLTIQPSGDHRIELPTTPLTQITITGTTNTANSSSVEWHSTADPNGAD